MRLVILLGSIVATLAVAGAALAHTGVESSSPKAGAVLAKAPAKVTVTFAEEIRSGKLSVRNASGKPVSKGPGGKDPANVRRLRVALERGLGAGRYTVRWSVTAADGDDQAGVFRFSVR